MNSFQTRFLFKIKMENAGCENGYQGFVVICGESNNRKSASSVEDEMIENLGDGKIANSNTIPKTT